MIVTFAFAESINWDLVFIHPVNPLCPELNGIRLELKRLPEETSIYWIDVET